MLKNVVDDLDGSDVWTASRHGRHPWTEGVPEHESGQLFDLLSLIQGRDCVLDDALSPLIGLEPVQLSKTP